MEVEEPVSGDVQQTVKTKAQLKDNPNVSPSGSTSSKGKRGGKWKHSTPKTPITPTRKSNHNKETLKILGVSDTIDLTATSKLPHLKIPNLMSKDVSNVIEAVRSNPSSAAGSPTKKTGVQTGNDGTSTPCRSEGTDIRVRLKSD